MQEKPDTNTPEIVRTEAITKADRTLIRNYQSARARVASICRDAAKLNERMTEASDAVPRHAAKLANAFAVRLGFEDYNALKAAGLDLSIDDRAGVVSSVKAPVVEAVKP